MEEVLQKLDELKDALIRHLGGEVKTVELDEDGQTPEETVEAPEVKPDTVDEVATPPAE